MSEEILVNITPQETALRCREWRTARSADRACPRAWLVGNIYKGVSARITRMQAAFIDIGLERAAFLHASDISIREVDGSLRRAGVPRLSRSCCAKSGVLSSHQGSARQQGARLTTHITFPHAISCSCPIRNVVCRRKSKRGRTYATKEIVLSHATCKAQVLLCVPREARPVKHWSPISISSVNYGPRFESARNAAPGAIVHEDLPLTLRVLRDLCATRSTRYVSIRARLIRSQPVRSGVYSRGVERLEYYPRATGVRFVRVEDEIQKAWSAKCSSSPAVI